uniref:Nuclear transcription factor Y subunit n=1 Tax=Caenorhabditis tropicalis TaxID=1561998 RepID=A0A1I7T0D8_9PELO
MNYTISTFNGYQQSQHLHNQTGWVTKLRLLNLHISRRADQSPFILPSFLCGPVAPQLLDNSRTLSVPMLSNSTSDEVKVILPIQSKLELSVVDSIQPKEDYPTSAHQAQPPAPIQQVVRVNSKQYYRILRRREMRQKQEKEGRLPTKRQKYMNESRHLLVVIQKEGSGGRFVENEPQELSTISSTVKQEKCHQPKSFLTGRITPTAASSLTLAVEHSQQPKQKLSDDSMHSTSSSSRSNHLIEQAHQEQPGYANHTVSTFDVARHPENQNHQTGMDGPMGEQKIGDDAINMEDEGPRE